MSREYPMVRVQIHLSPFESEKWIDIPLPVRAEYDALQPLKLPHPNDDAFDRLMCSSISTIRRVTDNRKEIAYVITKAILEALGKNDTVRGYTQAEAPDLHGPTSEKL